MVLDGLTADAAERVTIPESGPLRDRLIQFLASTIAGIVGPQGTGPALRGLMAEAQLDPEIRTGLLQSFVSARRQALREVLITGQRSGELRAETDLDLLVDLAFGLIWYRLLVDHLPLHSDVAGGLADKLLSDSHHPAGCRP